MDQKPKKKSNWWKYILVILLVIVIVFGLAWVLGMINNTHDNNTANTSNIKNGAVKDRNIVGSWDTGCLVPDTGSPWAERHTFIINSDGTAEHERFVGSSCKNLVKDPDDEFTYTIPILGKINLKYTSDNSMIYDIYEVSDNELRFGHGFCNCTKFCSNTGGATEADRFTCLNDFLVYKKQ